MTRTELHTMLNAIAPAVKTFVTTAIANALAPVREENKALAARVAELEARPQMKYMGTFTDGAKYEPGQLVTSSGSLWYCRSPTMVRPGFAADAWVLVAKKGRDGKDVRDPVKGAA